MSRVRVSTVAQLHDGIMDVKVGLTDEMRSHLI